MNIKQVTITIGAVIAAAAAQVAFASTIMDPNPSSGERIGTGYVAVSGGMGDAGIDTRPWTAHVYAAANECVRIWVQTQTFDAAISVVTPGGQFFRDDDSGGELRPLVMIAQAPVSGYYTVQVAHFQGAPVAGNFNLRYGRYSPGNANCSGAQSALVPAFSSRSK